MSGSLHSRLKQEAARTGQSLNQLCVAKLQSNTAYAGINAGTARAPVISPDFLEKVFQRWQRDLVGLILFGSAARGDATEDSDTDLLLVMNTRVKIARDLYRVWEEFCGDHAGVEVYSRISPHFVTLPPSVQDAGGLWYETALEGIVLWEFDHQVSRFLRSVREAMVQGKIQRRVVHGSPYWIREP
jgi:predicted nucleotidyltransferase